MQHKAKYATQGQICNTRHLILSVAKRDGKCEEHLLCRLKLEGKSELEVFMLSFIDDLRAAGIMWISKRSSMAARRV